MKHFNKCKDYHEQVQASRLTKLNWYHQTSFKPLITSDRTNYIHITLFVNKTQIIRVCFTLKKCISVFLFKNFVQFSVFFADSFIIHDIEYKWVKTVSE